MIEEPGRIGGIRLSTTRREDGSSSNTALRSISSARCTLLITLFHRLVCFTLVVAVDGISLRTSLHGLHRPEWNRIDAGWRKEKTAIVAGLKVDFISERASRERGAYHPSKSPFIIRREPTSRRSHRWT